MAFSQAKLEQKVVKKIKKLKDFRYERGNEKDFQSLQCIEFRSCL